MAASLVYGGYSDWRLPTTQQPDASCSNHLAGGISFGYNCTGSEMGHLFYADLGGTAGNFLLTSTDPDLAMFINIPSSSADPSGNSDNFWSATEYAPEPTDAWMFYTVNGQQRANGKENEYFAWAVRPGDVAAVPEPATLLLLLSGLGVMFIRSRSRSG